ncbi:MAG: substrate-binding domain-containing protein [Cytophagaceae bacterium]
MFKYSIYIFLCLLIACESPKEKSHGTIKIDTMSIYADPSWAPLLKEWQSTYEALNSHQRFKLLTLPELEVSRAFFHDSARLVFMSRGLNSNEKDYLTSKKRFIDVDTVAYDAIALIVSSSFQDSTITWRELQQWYQTGTIKGKQISIGVNMDGGAIPYFLETQLGKPNSVKHLYVGGSDEQLLASVKSGELPAAFISSYLISNQKNASHQDNLKKIKVLGIVSEGKDGAFWPVQEHIYSGLYPLVRPLVYYNYDRKDGIGTAFVAFIRHERGQRIVLKSGLLPHDMPARIVSLQ